MFAAVVDGLITSLLETLKKIIDLLVVSLIISCSSRLPFFRSFCFCSFKLKLEAACVFVKGLLALEIFRIIAIAFRLIFSS